MVKFNLFFLMGSGLDSKEVDSVPRVFHRSNTIHWNIALNLAKQNRYLLLSIYSCSSLLLQLEAGNFK